MEENRWRESTRIAGQSDRRSVRDGIRDDEECTLVTRASRGGGEECRRAYVSLFRFSVYDKTILPTSYSDVSLHVRGKAR